MTMPVTPLYAAVLGLIFAFLSVRTMRLRREFQVALGDGKQPDLLRAARVHANFAEYVPISLLLIYFLEIYTSSYWWIHALCIALLVGRIIHAYGVSQPEENYNFRRIGMALTGIVIVVASMRLLFAYFA
jgi:uncharacterized protein